MLRILARRSRDVTYFTEDQALELEGVRDGPAGRSLRGQWDPSDPESVTRCLTSTERSALVGYDLVVAAPRAISVLLAVDPAHAPDVVAAHRAAVSAAFDYLEDRALVVRDRRGGDDRDHPAEWAGAVSYTHGLNRHGEPHLHDHVLVGARPAGEHRVLDGRALYAHAPAADALYRSHLRHELSVRTPWRAWRSFEGVEHVAGLDEGYRALWAGHHPDRGQKLQWTREETVTRWRDDLTRFRPEVTLEAPVRRDVIDEHRFGAALEGRHDVSRRHVVAAWADAAVYGVDGRDVERVVDDLYPGLREGRGVREAAVGLSEARQIGWVRERGPRPLDPDGLAAWRQRSRERESGRSREWTR